MELRFWLTLMIGIVGIAASAAAQAPREPQMAGNATVLELFTSQGCSSCPAADKLFKAYSARRDIVALSMSVDYWDYLGWKDTLANAKFTKRQRTYANARGDGQVYTPQVVVNGRAHVVGSAKSEIEQALKVAANEPALVNLKADFGSKDMIEINLSAATGAGEMTVWIAVVQPEVQVDVKSGENRGQRLTYFNVVRELVPAGTWTGVTATIRHQAANLSGHASDRFAVFVQKGAGGPIMAATWIGGGKS
jgi:hypothetical protein